MCFKKIMRIIKSKKSGESPAAAANEFPEASPDGAFEKSEETGPETNEETIEMESRDVLIHGNHYLNDEKDYIPEDMLHVFYEAHKSSAPASAYNDLMNWFDRMFDSRNPYGVQKWKETSDRLIFRSEYLACGYHDKTKGTICCIQFYEYKDRLPEFEWLPESESRYVLTGKTSIPCQWYLLDDKSHINDFYNDSSTDYDRYTDKKILLLDPFGFKGIWMLDAYINDYYC